MLQVLGEVSKDETACTEQSCGLKWVTGRCWFWEGKVKNKKNQFWAEQGNYHQQNRFLVRPHCLLIYRCMFYLEYLCKNSPYIQGQISILHFLVSLHSMHKINTSTNQQVSLFLEICKFFNLIIISIIIIIIDLIWFFTRTIYLKKKRKDQKNKLKKQQKKLHSHSGNTIINTESCRSCGYYLT